MNESLQGFYRSRFPNLDGSKKWTLVVNLALHTEIEDQIWVVRRSPNYRWYQVDLLERFNADLTDEKWVKDMPTKIEAEQLYFNPITEDNLMPKGYYTHYKGGLYQVMGVGIGHHGKGYALYNPLYEVPDQDKWRLRPYKMFNEEVAPGVPRFKFLAPS